MTTYIHQTPPKKILIEAQKQHKSANALSNHFGVSRKVINRWLKEHNIEKNSYFRPKNKNLIALLQTTSFLDALELGHSKKEIQSYFWSRQISPPKAILLSKKETVRRCNLLEKHYSQGIQKALLLDPSLEKSILHWSQDHTLQSDKITERIYRLIHDFKSDEVKRCIVENLPLKFYTLKKGYGNSDKQVCYLVNDLPGKISKSSQQLFDAIVNKLTKEFQDKSRYATKGREYRVCILKNDPFNHPLRNKKNYYLDFKLDNINIEFDGSKWHNKEKDKVRDDYLKSRGYSILRVNYSEFTKSPHQTIQKCLDFIHENINGTNSKP